MRACLISPNGPSLYEWMIVSRWGTNGDHLSLGWTQVSAGGQQAPICLTPRHTAVAVRYDHHTSAPNTTFQLTSSVPHAVSVAGDFLPAEGCVQLYGTGADLRLQSVAESLNPALRPAWRVKAAREPWVGEFIEAHPDRSD